MDVDFIFRLRLRVQRPPCVSLLFKWMYGTGSCTGAGTHDRCAGDGQCHRKWIPPPEFKYKYGN